MRERNLIPTQVLADAETVDPMELTRLGVDAAKKQHFERGLILLSEAYRIFSLEREVTSEAVRDASWENEPEARRRAPGVTFSYYGLCLACTTSTRAVEAAKFCEIAIQKEPTRAEHYVNLARIWQVGRKRQKMVQDLDRGLAELPRSTPLIALRREVGIRGTPPLSFLPRSSKLNTTIGKILRRRPKG
jgi:tetratricopeptide (TPR) repeat protein